LCDQHKGHWFNRGLLIGGSLVLFSLIGFAGFLVLVVFQPPGGRNDLGSFACIGGLVLFIAWIIIAAIAQNTAIRPKEITDSEIVLQGVSSEFVDAYEELESERRARRRKRRQQRDEEDEDEEEEPRPRKKQAPSDAVQEKKRRPVKDEFEDQPRPRKKRPPSDDD
jgi:hypothetical protein